MASDPEELVAELQGRGLEAGAIEAVTADTRKAEILDADGNKVTFAENRTDD